MKQRPYVRVDIIGGGHVALALTKKILTSDIVSYLSSLYIWKKAENQYPLDIGGRSTLFEDTLHLFQMYMRRRSVSVASVEPEVRFYKKVSDLRSIVIENIEWESEGGQSVLLLLSKYHLSPYFGGNKTWDDLPNELQSVVRSVLSVESSEPTLDVSHTPASRFEEFQRRYKLIVSKLEAFAKGSMIVPERLYRLKDSALSISVLAQMLKKFPGTVLNFVNEVETTSMILTEVSEIPPERIMAPCQHDNHRVQYALQCMLTSKLGDVHVECPLFGPHNNLAFVPESQVVINGQTLDTFPHADEVRLALSPAIKWGTLYGEQLYRERGSSNEDSTLSLLEALEGIVFPEKSTDMRAICYYHSEKVFTGLFGRFDSTGTFVVKNNQLDALGANDCARFALSLAEQQALDRMFRELLYDKTYIYRPVR